MSRPILARLIAALSLLSGTTELVRGQQPAVWRAEVGEDVKHLSVTAAGAVLVQSKAGLAAFAADSGTRLWSRAEASDVSVIGDLPMAVARAGNSLRVIDLATGTDRWDFAKLGLSEPVRFVSLPWRRELLVYGPSAAGRLTMLSVMLDSGVVRWRQDTLLEARLRQGKPLALSQHVAPAVVGDTAILLDADEAGLLDVRLSDGAVLWRLPDAAIDLDRVSHLQVVDGTIYIVRQQTLVAADPATGAIKWKSQRNLPAPADALEMSSAGLVAGGSFMHSGWTTEPRVFVDVIDPATGASRWAKAIEIRGHSPFVVRGDTIFQPVTKGFRAFEPASGKALTDATLPELGGGEEPLLVEPVEGGDLVLLSAQNLLRVAPDGQVKYHRYLRAPGMSRLAKVAAITASVAVTAATGMVSYVHPVRYHATASVDRYAYIYTDQLIDGSGGFDLVRFDKVSGSEKGRVRMSERRPTYVVEPTSGTVVTVVGRELVAYRYPRAE